MLKDIKLSILNNLQFNNLNHVDLLERVMSDTGNSAVEINLVVERMIAKKELVTHNLFFKINNTNKLHDQFKNLFGESSSDLDELFLMLKH